jgi:hypothetical protein
MDDRANGTNNYDVYFMHIGTDGTPQGSATKVSEGGDVSDPSLVHTGSKFGLVWGWHRSQGVATMPAIFFGEVKDSGEKIGDAQIFEIGDAAPHAQVVWTGSKYAAAWHDTPNFGDTLTQIILAIP